jgi:His-Xaa-Ser system protein HxsD
MNSSIINNELHLYIEREIYDEDVIHKCLYWYGGNFSIDISIHSDKVFFVRLLSNSDANDFQKIIEKIKRDLIDFKLRQIVTKETQTIRELLVAKAFAYYELDDDPTTEISDPVGFSLKKIK